MPQEPAYARRRILLVGSDGDVLALLARHLAAGIGVDAAATGAEARECVERGRFDMLVLDLPLPDADASEFCRDLRRRGMPAPIVLLSGSRDEADAIHGLDSGANDFVVKPYHAGLLLARLRAHLRQFERSEDAVLEIGSHALDCGRRSVIERGTGRRIVLTAKESALLRYLYLNRDKPVRLATIMRDVWGHRDGLETHTAETHIYRLRQKLEADPGKPRLLVRVAGGYQLHADTVPAAASPKLQGPPGCATREAVLEPAAAS
jgi:DNA-binding response OmpR family regulator